MINRLPKPSAARPPSSSLLFGIAASIRDGFLPTDYAFDRVFPESLRAPSGCSWTHVSAAATAASWIRDVGAESVIDIGCGVGKFCIIGALRTEASFFGLEPRERLVTVARSLTDELGLADRVRFAHGSLGETKLPTADAFFLYDPTTEDTVDLDKRGRARDTKKIERLLREAPEGTYLLTYGARGVSVPASFELRRMDTTLPHALRMWKKALERDRKHRIAVDAR